MAIGTEEYITDVPYMRGFAADLSPLLLRLAAAMNGFASPPADDFDYCELGCAHGDTTATLAAAYPGARFIGVDINPEHIAAGERMARDGELGNVRFLKRDFADLFGEDIPQLDYITAHGVLGWVGHAKRKTILDFAAAKLKPGGLLYVNYNALPGWAAVEPLRHLLLDRGAAVKGNSIDRARAGVAFAKVLREGGAAYFTGNPAASEMLTKMEETGLTYVVHEYLHAHWVPMYFAQVAEEMAASGLYFVGQLPLHLNYPDLAVPSTLAHVFNEVDDRVTFETLKDYAINQFFRRDLYVKGRVLPDPVESMALLESTPFGTLMGEGAIARDVRLPHHTLHFNGPIFEALLPALEAGATSVGELRRLTSLKAFSASRIREAVVRLAVAHQVSPMLRSTRAAPAPAGRYRVPSAYNRMVLRDQLSNDHPILLASPVAGTGVHIPMLEGVILRLLTEVAVSEWPAWVTAFAARQPFRMRVGDQVVEDPSERARVLLGQVEPFRTRRLPRHIELGIVEPLPE